MKKSKKFALIHIGNDESYGMFFVAGELLRRGFQIQWFDGDCDGVVGKVAAWDPDFVLFSPMATFFSKSLRLSNEIKAHLENVRCVFGGSHVSVVPECLKLDGVDVVVVGPVYGTLDMIIASAGKELIRGKPISPAEMFPASRECYEAIPRLSRRPTKNIMSHFGCQYNCSYCSTSFWRKYYGPKAYKEFCLSRRPIRHLIEEAKVFLEYPTKEVALVDDDILLGGCDEQWLNEFALSWKKEIGLPIFGSLTPLSVLHASEKTLRILAELVGSVAMGIQAAREESLKLFNREFQSKEQVKAAYCRLQNFGIPARLEFIVGLPVDDPVGDALETVKLAQWVGRGTYVACFPLMLYPGTALYEWCYKRNIQLNKACSMEWHTGIGSLKFDDATDRKIRNITKLAALFVKYNIDEHWMRALIEMEMTEPASMKLSECQYYDSLLFRLGKDGVADFDRILAGMQLKY